MIRPPIWGREINTVTHTKPSAWGLAMPSKSASIPVLRRVALTLHRQRARPIAGLRIGNTA